MFSDASANVSKLNSSAWTGDAADAFRGQLKDLPRDLDLAAALAPDGRADAGRLRAPAWPGGSGGPPTWSPARPTCAGRSSPRSPRSTGWPGRRPRPAAPSSPGSRTSTTRPARSANSVGSRPAGRHRARPAGCTTSTGRPPRRRPAGSTTSPTRRTRSRAGCPGPGTRSRAGSPSTPTCWRRSRPSSRASPPCSGVLSLVPGLQFLAPFAVAAGAIALGIDVAIKLATGKGSWASIGIDAALTFLPGGKILDGLKGVKAAVAGERGWSRGSGRWSAASGCSPRATTWPGWPAPRSRATRPRASAPPRCIWATAATRWSSGCSRSCPRPTRSSG